MIFSILHGPNIFINKPKTKRLLYKWHSEANFYPKREVFKYLVSSI